VTETAKNWALKFLYSCFDHFFLRCISIQGGNTKWLLANVSQNGATVLLHITLPSAR